MDVYLQLLSRIAYALLGLSFLILIILVPGIGLFGGEDVRSAMYEFTGYVLVILAELIVTPEWMSSMLLGWVNLIPVNKLIESSNTQMWWVINTWRVWLGLLLWLWLLVYAALFAAGALGFFFKKAFLR